MKSQLTQYEICDLLGKNQNKLLDLSASEKHLLLTICFSLRPKGYEIQRNLTKFSKAWGRKFETTKNAWESLVEKSYIREVTNGDSSISYYVNVPLISDIANGERVAEAYERLPVRGAAKKSLERKRQQQNFRIVQGV